MVVARAAATIELTEDEERALRSVLPMPSASQQDAMRARIVLLAADGASNTEIAGKGGVSLLTVVLWRRNFCERRVHGYADAPRSGRPRDIDDDEVPRVLLQNTGAAAGREHALECSPARGRDRHLVLDSAQDPA